MIHVRPLHRNFLLALTCALTACHKAPPPAPASKPIPTAEPISITTAKAEMRKMPRYLRVTGQLIAARDARVASDGSGKALEVPVERGSLVKKGDVLVKLDDRTAALSLREAEASVALAEAQIGLSRSELKRNEPLAKSHAIAEADFLKLKTDLAAKEAQLASVMARRDLAQKSVTDAVVLAPFSGTVAERMVTVGEFIGPGMPVAQLVETSRLKLAVNIPESGVGKVSVNQKVEFTVASFPGQVFEGRLKFLGAAIREATRDLPVEADVANEDGKLKPGLFAEARIVLAEESAITVPANSIRTDGVRRKVFVSENQQLTERLVEVGESTAEWIEIRRGVTVGELVMLNPGPEATDGAPVRGSAQP
jgi:membrane fusion protein, multidrug efflux system